MATIYAMISKNGDRPYNEDSVRAEVSGNCACFVLADGLGGHGGGADASKLVVDSVLEQFRNKGLSGNFLPECFEKSQRLLLDYQQKAGRENEMKTTLVVLTKTGKTVQWGHIGDSRLYCFRKTSCILIIKWTLYLSCDMLIL